MNEPMVRVEIRNDGILNEMCEGSVEQAIAFLKAREIKDDKDKK